MYSVPNTYLEAEDYTVSPETGEVILDAAEQEKRDAFAQELKNMEE